MSDLADLIRDAVPGASNRAIAAQVGVSPETINRIMRGDGAPDVETVDKIADTLKINVERAREAASLPRGNRAPYEPPAEANLLDDRQRRALDELIRSIVRTQGAQHDVEATTEQDAPSETGKDEKTKLWDLSWSDKAARVDLAELAISSSQARHHLSALNEIIEAWRRSELTIADSHSSAGSRRFQHYSSVTAYAADEVPAAAYDPPDESETERERRLQDEAAERGE